MHVSLFVYNSTSLSCSPRQSQSSWWNKVLFDQLLDILRRLIPSMLEQRDADQRPLGHRECQLLSEWSFFDAPAMQICYQLIAGVGGGGTDEPFHAVLVPASCSHTHDHPSFELPRKFRPLCVYNKQLMVCFRAIAIGVDWQ